MITLIILLSIVILACAFMAIRSEHRDSSFMFHTIEVNLSILEPELVFLKGKAEAILSGAETAPEGVTIEAAQEARDLLEQSERIATSARQRIHTVAVRELGGILGEVFDAMSKATDARILLKAIVPPQPGGFIE